MMQPRKVKWRKQHRPKLKGIATRGNKLEFGDYGLKSLEYGRIFSNQIEAMRVAIVRGIGKKAKFWIRIFPHIPYTKKPAEVRMGGGKGDVEGWFAFVKPGTMIVEITGVGEEEAIEALRIAASKLPVKTKIVKAGEVF